MTTIATLIEKIEEIHLLQETKKTVEKAKILFYTEEAKKKFKVCYEDFLRYRSIQNSRFDSECSHLELLTGIAEAAYYTSNFEIARKFIEEFLQRNPQKDQFFCRMQIVLGLVIHVESSKMNGIRSIEQNKKAIQEIMLALDVSTQSTNSSRYKFIVFNSSLAFWTIVRGFLRSGRARHFAQDFNKVITSIEQQEDYDKYWRILLLSAGSICAEDDKNVKNSVDYLDKAILILDQMLVTTTQEEQFQVELSLACNKDVDLAMNALRLIEEREELIRKPRKIDPDLPDDDEYYTKPLALPPLQGLAASGADNVKNILDIAQSKKSNIEQQLKIIIERKKFQTEYLARLYCERISVCPADTKKILGLPAVVKDTRIFCLLQAQSIISNAVPEKEWDATFLQCIKKLEETSPSEDRSETLLDLSRTAWSLNLHQVAKKCADIVKSSNSHISRMIRIKLDICEFLCLLYSIEDVAVDSAKKQLLTSKQIHGLRVSKRLDAIKLLERTLSTTVSFVENKFLIHEMIVLLWNALIPLLYKKMRSRIHFALKTIANAIEDLNFQSNTLLRSQVHYELALCEEAADYAGIAVGEVEKAINQDYGLLDQKNPVNSDLLDLNRISDQYLFPYFKSLSLRIDIYASPSDPEDQALLWLQQAKESGSRPLIKEMISKIYILISEDASQSSISDTSSNTPVDWSLFVLKKGKICIPDMTVLDIEKSLDAPNIVQNCFSFKTQRLLHILTGLAKLAFSIEDSVAFFYSFCRIITFSWNINDAFSIEFLDEQIELLSCASQCISWRLEQNKKSFKSTNQLNGMSEQQFERLFAMGIDYSSTPEESRRLKVLALKFIDKAFQIAINRKDSYSVTNVLVYFWNLHLHIFRDSFFEYCLEDFTNFIKKVCQSVDLILSFPGIKDCCDIRLFCNIFEAAGDLFSSKGQIPNAVEILLKGASINFPNVINSSSSSGYYKKALVEKASKLNILSAANGTVGTGKGATKGSSQEPLTISDNVWLNFYSYLAVAELYPGAENITKDILYDALEKAGRMYTTTVIALVEKEIDAEAKGLVLRNKDYFDQRLEMRLECLARLSRMYTIHNDFVVGQNYAEDGIKLFAEQTAIVVGNAGTMSNNNFTDYSMVADLFNNRIIRWIANCEMSLSLAVVAFLERSSKSDSSVLDPALVAQLQLAVIQHLQPSIAFASLCQEESLMCRAANIAVVMMNSLLREEKYFSVAYSVCQVILRNLVSGDRSAECLLIIKSLYLTIATALISRKAYDEALKVIISAFDKLPSPLQKDLWPARVICMSRKGMSVLDGLQKLKEKDPILQARVLVLFARSTKDLKSKIGAYQQAIDLLDKRVEKVEYVVELAEVLNAYGLTRNDIKFVLLDALSFIRSLEESQYLEVKDWDGFENGQDFIESLEKKSHTSIPRSRKTPSVTGKDTLSIPPSVKAVSAKGSASLQGNLANGVAESTKSIYGDNSRPSCAASFKELELGMRISTMLALAEINHSSRVQYCMEAYYFVERALAHWAERLTNHFKVENYKSLSDDLREKTPLEDFSVEIPSYLQLPIDSAELLSWSFNLSFRQYSIDCSEKLALDVPSTSSLPSLNPTIHCMFCLISLLSDFMFIPQALYTIAFTRLVLWSYPEYASEEGKNAALVSLQLIADQILRRVGASNAQVVFGGNFILSKDSTTVSPGTFIQDILNTLDSNHFQEDLLGQTLLDLKYDDFLLLDENPQSPFQIEACPDNFDSLSTISRQDYMAKIANSLYNLGQYAIAERLCLSLLWEFRGNKYVKAYAKVVIVVFKIMNSKGFYQETISQLLSIKSILCSVGDCNLLRSHFSLLISAYEKSGAIGEALDVANLLITLLEDLALREIVKIGDQPATCTSILSTKADRSSQNKSTTKLSNVASHLSIATHTEKNLKRFSQTELAYEYLEAWKDTVADISRLMSINAERGLKARKDTDRSLPLQIHSDMISLIDRSIDILKEYVGENSIWIAELQSLRVKYSMKFIKEFHQFSSHLMSLEEYESWLQNHISLNLNNCNEIVRNNKIRASMIEIGDSPVTNMVESTSFKTSDLIFDYGRSTFLSCIQYSLAASQLELGYVQWVCLVLQMKHIVEIDSSGDSGDCRGLNPVEKYLIETTASEKLASQRKDFITNSLENVFALGSISSIGLGRSRDEPAAKIMSLIAQLGLFSFQQQFENAWRQSDSMPRKVIASHLALESQNVLEQLILHNADSDIPSMKKLIPHALMMLIETRGSGSPFRAACSLFQMQSFAAKEYLSDIWRQAVGAKNEFATALRRLDLFEEQNLPRVEELLINDADKYFANAQSNATKRLSIAADCSRVMSAVASFSKFVVHCCIQFCPLHKTLYLCCGFYGNGGDLTSDTKTSSKPSGKGDDGKSFDETLWFVDKMILSEEQRRTLQVNIHQHRQFQEDCLKFVATYGESIGENDDLEECGPSSTASFQTRSTAQKFERALDESLGATINDMETIFLPLVGKASKLRSFLQSIVGNNNQWILHLYIDPTLHSLPIEALACFDEYFCGRIVRDFSLHMLNHRVQAFAGDGAQITSSGVRIIVDPLKEDDGVKLQGKQRKSINENFTGLQASTAGGSKWLNLRSRSGALSTEDYILNLDSSNASLLKSQSFTTLFVHCLGRFGSFFSPNIAASLNLDKTKLIVVLDNGHNDNSIRRQNTSDVLKSKTEIELENWLSMTALLSLAGVGNVSAMKWSIPLASQQRILLNFWKNFGNPKKEKLIQDKVVSSFLDLNTSVDKNAGSRRLKRWVKYSRVMYGISCLYYTDT